MVCWDDIQVFLSKLNGKTGKHYRLPTEAEWEYAARGGNKSRGYKYSGSNNIDDVAWFSAYESTNVKTHAVGTKKANELGIYNMSGNVWEWCSDYYGDYSSVAQKNPKGPSTGSYRVVRGGCFYYYAPLCRVTARFINLPNKSSGGHGFRLVLVP
jgi:formylglycine-generating enzyme required for sulfatase activity